MTGSQYLNTMYVKHEVYAHTLQRVDIFLDNFLLLSNTNGNVYSVLSVTMVTNGNIYSVLSVTMVTNGNVYSVHSVTMDCLYISHISKTIQ